MGDMYIFPIICSLIAIIYGCYLVFVVLSKPAGSDEMQKISKAIQQGAKAFLNRQYKMITLVGIFVFLLLSWQLGLLTGIGFLIGSVLSGATGYIGMNVSVRGNVRVAEAAKKGIMPALNIAFKSGSITGMLVVGLALLGTTVYYVILREVGIAEKSILEALVALSFGASLISIFARLGGGIFTKGADVGADLVGKIEAGIPEDDPRNPAVIADNVGDNVGDCAGMAADLFETYLVTIVGTILLGSIFFKDPAVSSKMMFFPLAIGAVGILTSIIGTFFVKIGKKQNIMGALYKGFITTAFLSIIAIGIVTYLLFGFKSEYHIIDEITFSGLNLFYCGITGIVVTGLLMWITEYYTSTKFNPVKSIAQASTTGHATNIIQGLAIGMKSAILPVVVICIGILVSYLNAELYGVAIAATSMLSLAGMIVALDSYGPVTDNAGGIAQMANLDKDVRKITDALDAVGNTTKAVTKGYAIASAGFGALVLFTAFIEDLSKYFPDIESKFYLQNPYVIIGLFLGGMLPYLFGALGMTSVGKAAASIVTEVRRQFKEIPGIMTGKELPEYGVAVDLLTKAAIKEMIIPSLIPVLAPVIVFFAIYFIVDISSAFVTMGSLLLGTVVTGIFMAFSMTGGGGAWDNAKKYIEDGNLGGKGSDAHKAAITGDTVGDPYKDTVGPAINPMIKIITITSLLLLAILAKTFQTS
ncbi:MAG: K(+)-insensitive pyrophosphate-energized proton pump [Candidatus Anoxychlamydiales bacterium]|nr:K(+)-insensitive pyrophosphate-energized proton pump [Candidatus Anoxychlamydiales bacterium]